MNNFNLDDLDVPVTEVQNAQTTVKKTNDESLYSPNPVSDKKCVDNTYEATIRLLPNPADPKTRNILKKSVYWMDCKDDLNIKQYFETPSNIKGECMLMQTFYALKARADKGDAAAEINKKKFQLKTQFHCYAYIIEDKQHPELQGKVVVFRFNDKINKLIEKTEKPTDAEIKRDGAVPTNVFNPFIGKDLFLKLIYKNGQINFDDCKFFNTIGPIEMIDPTTGNTIKLAKDDKHSREFFQKEIVEKMPNLDLYDYKENTPIDLEKIRKIKAFYLNEDSTNINTVQTASVSNVPTTPKVEKPIVSETPKVTETVVNEPVNNSDDDDLDQFLNDL